MFQSERYKSNTDVYTMPLIDVPLKYEADGLDERLWYRLGELGLRNNDLIRASLVLGTFLHQNDRRSYEPYPNHPRRATLRLIEDFGETEPVAIAGELLHDTVEDHSKELASTFLHIETPADPVIERELGVLGLRVYASKYEGAEELPDLVKALSNPIVMPNEDKIESYIEHSALTLLQGPPKPRRGKLADNFDNFDVPEGIEDPRKRARLDRKQIHIYSLVRESLMLADSKISVEQQQRLLQTLDRRHQEALARIEAVTLSRAA